MVKHFVFCSVCIGLADVYSLEWHFDLSFATSNLRCRSIFSSPHAQNLTVGSITSGRLFSSFCILRSPLVNVPGVTKISNNWSPGLPSAHGCTNYFCSCCNWLCSSFDKTSQSTKLKIFHYCSTGWAQRCVLTFQPNYACLHEAVIQSKPPTPKRDG